MLKLRGWLKSSTQPTRNNPTQDPSPAATSPQTPASHATQKDKYGNYGEVNSPYARKARRQLEATLRDEKKVTSASKNHPLALTTMNEEKKFKTKIQPAPTPKRSGFKPTLETIHEQRDTPQMTDGVTTPELPDDQPKSSRTTPQDPPGMINRQVQ